MRATRANARSTPRAIRPVRKPYAHATAAARALCAPLGLREPRDIDVEAIAWTLGAIVVPRPSPRGEGHLLRDRASGRAIIAVREAFHGTPKGRFVAAHEIGHLLLHPDADALPRCTGAIDRLPPGARRVEGEANDAASEIVTPEEWFVRAMGGCAAPTLEELRATARLFDVSLTATALRALQFATTPSALVVVERGVVAWWACSEGWDVYVHRKARVNEGTLAARALGGSGVPREGVVVDGAAWGDVEGDGERRVAVREAVVASEREDVALAWLTRVGSR